MTKCMNVIVNEDIATKQLMIAGYDIRNMSKNEICEAAIAMSRTYGVTVQEIEPTITREQMIALIKEADESPERLCPRFENYDTEGCEGCLYDAPDGKCDVYAKRADFFIRNGVFFPKLKIGSSIYLIYYDKDYPHKMSVEARTISDISVKYIFIEYPNGFCEKYSYSDIGSKFFLTEGEARKELTKRLRRGERNGVL